MTSCQIFDKFLFFVVILQGKIVYSQKCDLDSYPNIIALVSSDNFHFCGGILLQERWVLTAAHCLYAISKGRAPPEYINFRVKGKGKFPGTFKLTRTTKIILPDIYDPKTLENDFCLLHLEHRLPFVEFTAIGSKALILYFVEVETDRAVAITWEQNRHDLQIQREMTPVCLYERLHTFEYCHRTFDIFQNGSMLCAKSKSGDQPLAGDSGSPLFLNEILIGLVSSGTEDDVKDVASIFARTDKAIDFIESTVKKFGAKLVFSDAGKFGIYFITSGNNCSEISIILFLLSSFILFLR